MKYKIVVKRKNQKLTVNVYVRILFIWWHYISDPCGWNDLDFTVRVNQKHFKIPDERVSYNIND
jgi:hypothetical protein